MKKTTIMRIASTLLIAVLLTTCAIGATFAKYTSSITASDTAKVAVYAVKAFDQDVDTVSQTHTIDLFSTVVDTKDVDDYVNADITQDADIRVGSTAPIIAPGSWGKYSFKVENDSDVAVEYVINYTIDAQEVPLEFSTDGTTWTTDITDVTATKLTVDSEATTVTIYWRWAFTGADSATLSSTQTDVKDTALGTAATTVSPTIDIEVIFTQVD